MARYAPDVGRTDRRRVAPGALIAIGVFLALFALGGCTSGDSGSETGAGSESASGTDSETGESAADSGRELKPTIRLAVTDWTAAQLNASIAEQLVERRLGYPVEQVGVIDTGTMLGDLAAGELDAILEVWPSSLEPPDREMITGGRVADLGDLGVIGKTGWFVPRYVVEANGALASWEAYADSGVARDFATAETGSKGRFLGTDTNYEQFDEQIIDALDLPFEVVFSGSDEATAAELTRARDGGDPVLLFWWTPTAEIVKFDLVNVALPTRTPGCESDISAGEPQRCDYPADRLQKLASPALEEIAPDAFRFLQNFSLTTNDQLLMIDQVENGGRSVDAVAAGWIDENQGRWEAWITDG